MAHLELSVLPVSSLSFFLLGPSTSTRCTRPTSVFCLSPAVVLNASMTSASLRCLTSSGTSSSR